MSSPVRPLARADAPRLALLAIAVLATSCSEALGDFSFVERKLRRSDAGAAPPDGAGFTPSCEVGQVTCDGTVLATCVRPDQGTPLWVPSECAPEGTCQSDPSPRCVPAICQPGEAQCLGSLPQRCGDDLDWQSLDGCQSAAHCSSDPELCPGGAPCCLTAPCRSGEFRCNRNAMERCNADETDWEPVDDCQSPELCEQGLTRCEQQGGGACACLPPVCAPNETRCVGTALERCAASLVEFEAEEECATPELCERGLEFPSSCERPACDPGETSCTEAGVLERCREDRTGFDVEQVCDGPPFCDAEAGVCVPAECRVGEQRCSGAQIQRCLADRTGFENVGPPCASAALCNDDNPAVPRCDPPQCDEDEFRCFGAQPQRCNADRTGFQNAGFSCPRADLCSEERERCDTCVPNRQECTPDATARRTCADDGNGFGPETDCPLGCVRANGTCQSCGVGDYACFGNSIALCEDGASFTPLGGNTDCSGNLQMTCSGGQLDAIACGTPGCDPTRDLCNECTGQERQCVGQAAFRQCAGGVFGPAQPCAGGLSCEGAGGCGCDELAGPRCDGGQLEQCEDNAFVPAARCAGAVLRACQPGDATPDQIDCGTPASCQAAVGATCG